MQTARLHESWALHLQGREVIEKALQAYLSGSADFAECLILAKSARAGHELATFDRKLGRLAGASLLLRKRFAAAAIAGE